MASSSASEFRSGATRKEGVASKGGAKNRRRSEIAVAPVGSLQDMSGAWPLAGHFVIRRRLTLPRIGLNF